MTAPLLQLASVTKSFGAVYALRGVSFALRAGVPSQPGELSDISRGLSTATPPVAVSKKSRTPEGCQNRSGFRTLNCCNEPLARAWSRAFRQGTRLSRKNALLGLCR